MSVTVGAPKETDGAETWLAHLPPTAGQTWSAIAVAAAVLVAFAAVAPFAGTPLAQINLFFPLLDAIVFVTDLVTAVLLFAQFSISRSRALLILAIGYLFTALIVVPHALTFSGAFSPTGLLGANIQTGSWLFIFWHFGFAAALLAYAAFAPQRPVSPVFGTSALPAIGWSVAAVLALVCGLTWLATAGARLLPPIILDQSRISPIVVYPIWLTILTTAAALAVLAVRRRSVLNQWLMVVAFVYIAELAFSGLFASIRFSAGFYAGRVFSLITASIVLIVLLAELTRLYALLSRSNAMLRREQDNKLMNFEAVVASISHEIRQPLGAIELNSGSARLLLKEAALNVEELRAILDEMNGAGRRINETLDSFRSLFGKVDERRQPLNLNDVVLEALQSSRGEMKDDGVTLRTTMAFELPRFYGARNQLYLVVYNLVHNAIEAMRGMTDRDRVLDVRTELRDGNTIVIEVADTGPGIKPEEMTEIFGAFVTTKPHGMGLGLAICRMIVERHDGQLSVSSTEPNGAVFRIALPQANSPQ